MTLSGKFKDVEPSNFSQPSLQDQNSVTVPHITHSQGKVSLCHETKNTV